MNSKNLKSLLILSLVVIFNIAPCYPITTGTASDSLDSKPSQIYPWILAPQPISYYGVATSTKHEIKEKSILPFFLITKSIQKNI